MKKSLILIFLALVAIKIAIATLLPAPLAFSDSLTHLEVAKKFFENPSIDNSAYSGKSALYPIAISPAFVFTDMNNVHFAVYIINALLSSLIIFPAYLLTRNFMNKKKSLLIATIVGFLPGSFVSSFYILSENLFMPLSLTTIYCLYKAFTTKNILWDIISGILIGLCLATRTIAVFLIPTLAVLILREVIQRKTIRVIIRRSTIIISAILTILPLIIRNYFFRYTSEINKVSQATNILSKIIWAMLYPNYLIIATGVLFFIIVIGLVLAFKKISEPLRILLIITLASTFFLFLILANTNSAFPIWSDHRMLGRYLEPVVPLFIILGFVGMEHVCPKKKLIVLTAFYLMATLPLILLTSELFPIANTSISHIGVISFLLEKIHIPSAIILSLIVGIATFSLLAIRKFTFSRIFVFFAIYFIVLTGLSTAIAVYDSQVRWSPIEEVKLGYWINQNIDPRAKFLLDDDEINETFLERPIDTYKVTTVYPIVNKKRSMLVIAYWIRGKYTVDTIDHSNEYDYIITTKNLDLPLVKEGETIKIYKEN